MKKNTLLFLLTVSITLWITACSESNGKDKPKTQPTGDSSKVMNKEVQSFFEVEESGVRPGVVFVLYENGRIQAFRRHDQKPVEFKRGQPIPAGKIMTLKSIAIVETSNPKYCWIDGVGFEKCVTW